MANEVISRDEFETVKQLLFSAASYAESANRQSYANSQHIASLSEGVDGLKESQKKTQQQIDQLTNKVDSLTSRIDSFVFESQRLLTTHAERINRLDAMIDRYDGVLAYLMRKEEGDR